MRGFIEGTIPMPPMGRLMNMDIRSVDTGTVVFTATPDESHYNPLGIVHGGFACTVLDTVVGCAAHTTLPLGFGYTSLELKVSYLRPLTRDSGEVTATGRVVKPGRRVAFSEGELVDAAGNVIATGPQFIVYLVMWIVVPNEPLPSVARQGDARELRRHEALGHREGGGQRSRDAAGGCPAFWGSPAPAAGPRRAPTIARVG